LLAEKSDDDSEAISSEFDLSCNTEESQSTETRKEEDQKSEVISVVPAVKKPPETDVQEAERKAFNDVVLLIQSNERARVGRRIARNGIEFILAFNYHFFFFNTIANQLKIQIKKELY
jgi:hypothetical protein